MQKLRIFLADDHVVVREGIKRLIDSQPDLELVGEAGDGQETLDKVSELQPAVVMMDISMPRMNGMEATRLLKAKCPTTKVLALTVHEDEAYVRECLRAGASGYLLKRATTEELLRAIRVVGSGDTYIDARVAHSLIKTLTHPPAVVRGTLVDLSEREAQVMRLIALGYSNKEISAQLGVSIKTVETYKQRSMEKLGLKSRVDIVRLASERGWLNQSPPPAG